MLLPCADCWLHRVGPALPGHSLACLTAVQLNLQAAKEGITAAVGRYAAARSLLSVLGPLVWASTAFELLSVSMGTDWSRVVKATFCIAQIRLLRTYGWSQGARFSNVGDVGR
jgi:uncharacterized protein YaaW (UPF0174 family)